MIRSAFFLLALFVMAAFAFQANVSISPSPGEKNLDITKINPGMNSEEFRKTFPGIFPETDAYNGKGFETKKYNEIEGGWNYEFANNVLVRATFNWHQILQYDDLNEGKSNKALTIFKNTYPSAETILQLLTENYGEPESKTISDTVGLAFTWNTYSTELITAQWKKGETTIQLRYWFDGKERPNPYQNYNNMAAESDNFRLTIEVMGEEKNQSLHFRIGETAQEMEKRNPAIFKNGTGLFGTFRHKASLGELDGEWEFCLKNSVLKKASFHQSYYENYDQDITESEYNKLIEDYQSAFTAIKTTLGKPDSNADEIPDFKTFNKRNVTGEDFLNCSWEEKKQEIYLSLRHHFGGKGKFRHSMYFEVTIYPKDGKAESCY